MMTVCNETKKALANKASAIFCLRGGPSRA